MRDTSERIFRQADGILSETADGSLVLLALSGGQYFSLEGVGSRIWELCDGTVSVGAIVDVICDEFEVSSEIAEADVSALLDELATERLVVQVSSQG